MAMQSAQPRSRDGWGALLSGEFQCRTSSHPCSDVFFGG